MSNFAYAKDKRFHLRIRRWDSVEEMEDAWDSHYEPIADEQDAYMLALGYTLDDYFNVWRGEGAGDDGIDVNDTTAINDIISNRNAYQSDEDIFWIEPKDE